ncbi:MAG: hypothetical protein ACOCRX_05240, partial [Candidatus Woesearchaeota archaeon]
MKKNKHKKVLLFFILFIMVSSITFADTIISINATATMKSGEPSMGYYSKTFTIKEHTTIKYSLKTSSNSWYERSGSVTESGRAHISTINMIEPEEFLSKPRGTVNMATSEVLPPGKYKLIFRGWEGDYVQIYIPDTPQLPNGYKFPPSYEKIEISRYAPVSRSFSQTFTDGNSNSGPITSFYEKKFNISKTTDILLSYYVYSVSGIWTMGRGRIYLTKVSNDSEKYYNSEKVYEYVGTKEENDIPITLAPGKYLLTLGISHSPSDPPNWEYAHEYAIVKYPKDVTPEINPISNKTINE